MALKPEKNKQNTLLPCPKTTHYFSQISVFLHTVFVLQLLCFSENTIKIVLSEKTQLFKNTISKTHFFTHVKNIFAKKNVISGFGQFPLKPLFYQCFLVYPVLGQIWPKQIVRTKMRVFLPSWHKLYKAMLAKNPFFWFFTFLDDHLKKHYFYMGLGVFSILFFLFFLFSISPT